MRSFLSKLYVANTFDGKVVYSMSVQFSSVTQSCLTLCDPMDCSMPGFCPSPTPRACSNSCPLSWWCHPTISYSVIPVSFLQVFPASRSFPMSQFLASGGQNIGVSDSASVLPMNTQDQFPLELTGLISLQSKELSESSPIPRFKNINSSAFSFLYSPNLTFLTWLLEKNIALTICIFVGKVMSLLFNMLCWLKSPWQGVCFVFGDFFILFIF